MADTDVTVTLAGQFSKPSISERQQKLIEVAGKGLIALSISTKPTVAQWNTLIRSASGLFSPNMCRDMQAQRAAIYWQCAVTTLNAGEAVAGKSTNQILNITSYLQGLDDATLEALSLYCEGKSLFSSVFA